MSLPTRLGWIRFGLPIPLVVLGFFLLAAACVSCAPAPHITLSPTSGAPSSVFTVSGTSFSGKTSLSVTWDSSSTGMPAPFTSNPNGSFNNIPVTVPSGATGGNHTVTVSGGGSASATFSVTGVATSTPTSTSTPTPTQTSGPGTSTPTPAPTNTAVPTSTSTPTATSTPVPCGGAGLINLCDNFNDGVRDSSKWSLGTIYGLASANVTVAETTQLVITPPSSYTGGNAYNGYLSATTWNLTNNAVMVNVVQTTALVTGEATEFTVGIDAGNHLQISEESGALQFRYNLSGNRTTLATVAAYSTCGCPWWRIRESSGTVYFETSADGLNWGTPRAQVADPFSMTAVLVGLSAGSWVSVASPGSALFDSLDIPPVVGSTPTATGTATATSTATATATATATGTPLPTSTPTIIPTSTPTWTALPTSTPTPLPNGLIGLTDDFTDGVMNINKWGLGTIYGLSSSNVTVSEPSQLQIAPPANYSGGNAYNGYLSSQTWDLTNRAVMVQVVQTTALVAGTATEFSVGIDTNNHVQISVESGALIFRYNQAGARTTLFTIASYSGCNCSWWRIRESAGKVYFETSPDGLTTSTWTRRNPLDLIDPFNMTAVRVGLSAGIYQSVGSPGVADFDNLDVIPVPGSTVTFNPTVIPLSATTPTYGEIANPFRGLQKAFDSATVIDPADWPYNVSKSSADFFWSQLESTLGSYNFTNLDSHLADAQTRKGVFGFRMMANATTAGGPFVPQYVWDYMVANKTATIIGGIQPPYTYVEASSGHTVYMPDFDHAYFLSRTQALIQAMANHVTNYPASGGTLANDPRLGWVEPGMGIFGEWHVADAPYYTRCNPVGGCSWSRYAWTAADGEQIVNWWRQYFPNTRIVLSPTDDTVAAYTLGLDSRYSWRHDCIGDPSMDTSITLSSWWPTYKNLWQHAPIMAEGCGTATVALNHDQAIFYHVATFDHDLQSAYSTYSASDQASAREYRKLSGYRFQLNSLTLPTSLHPGNSFTATSNWSNVGITPAYNSWQVKLQLRDTATNAVVTWSGISSLSLSSLLPTTQWSSWTGGSETSPTPSADVPVNQADGFALPTSVPLGTYNVVVVITDPAAYFNSLSLANASRQTDGSYILGTIAVQ